MSPRQTLWGWLLVMASTALFAIGLTTTESARPVAFAGTPDDPAADNRAPAATSAGHTAIELLPKDPVIYIGTDGVAEHQREFEATALYQAFYATGFQPVVEKMFREVMPQNMPRESRIMEQFTESLGQNGFQAAVALPGEMGPSLPWAIIVLPKAATFAAELDKLVRKAAESDRNLEVLESERDGRKITSLRTSQFPPGEFSWWVNGADLVLVGGVNATDQAMAVASGDAPNLTESRLWQEYHKFEVKDDQASFLNGDLVMMNLAWFDAAKAANAAGPISVPTGDPERQVTIGKILEASGLNGLRSVVVRGGYDGPATWSELRVETKGDREGLLALGSDKAITLDDLPPLPASSSGISVMSVDFAASALALVNAAQNLVALGPPREAERFQRNLEAIPDRLGFDPISDLLEPFGDIVTVYYDEGQGLLGFGLSAVVSVDDAATLRQTFQGLLRRLERSVPPNIASVSRLQKQGENVVSIEIMRGAVNPTFVVTDDWFVLSLVPQGVELFLLREQGKLPHWKPEGEIAKALEGLPENITGLVVADPRPFVKLFVGLGTAALPAVRAALAEQQKIEQPLTVSAADLPPTELVIKPLFPNVSVSFQDGDSLVWQSRASVGGGADGALVTAAAVGFGAGLLLPAVQQARMAARRAQSTNNLKQMAIAIHNYHDTYNHMPRGTVDQPDLKPAERLSWQVSILPFVEQSPLYQRYTEDQAWNQGQNQLPASTVVPVYRNPAIAEAVKADAAMTNYVGWAGVGKDAPTLPNNDPKAGMFGYDRETRFADVRDGMSNTIMISEATAESSGPYAQGGKSTIRALTKKPYINGPDGIGGPYSGGFNACFADGAVRFLSQDVDPTVLEAMATKSGGETVDVP